MTRTTRRRAAKPTTTTDTAAPLIIALDVTTYTAVDPGAINIRTYSRVDCFCRSGVRQLPRMIREGEIINLHCHDVTRTIATAYACILPGADIDTMACVVGAYEACAEQGMKLGPHCELLPWRGEANV